MSRVIEPVASIGISAADVADAGDMLESYYRLFTPLLHVGNNVSAAMSICEG
jgi:hypothetical protein